ncbi:unnamed protein product [Medioppia subpectinata]|uniref:Uncharacterized protein n=1 Tax=Medioppia subpectinata TaxID=1979941 RepID=A0A7R9KP19_9ACAR|nr:unnamed protein product [Medioppia subpectinata]CAG2105731.1 unnamed protein product [Medioppia subpectinata]
MVSSPINSSIDKNITDAGQHILTRINHARNSKVELVMSTNLNETEENEISEKIFDSFLAATVNFKNHTCLTLDELSMRDWTVNNCYQELTEYLQDDLHAEVLIGEFAYSDIGFHALDLKIHDK